MGVETYATIGTRVPAPHMPHIDQRLFFVNTNVHIKCLESVSDSIHVHSRVPSQPRHSLIEQSKSPVQTHSSDNRRLDSSRMRRRKPLVGLT